MASVTLMLSMGLIYVTMVTSFTVHYSRTQRDSVERYISYTNENGVVSDQRVTVTDWEAEFQILDGMHAVLDYKQNLMTLRRTTKETICLVAPYKPKITLEQIREMIMNNDKFEMPIEQQKLQLQRAADQSSVKLSPLSAITCEGAKIIRMEPKKEVTALSTYRVPMRPKREVGWGEVILIVIVVIILL